MRSIFITALVGAALLGAMLLTGATCSQAASIAQELAHNPAARANARANAGATKVTPGGLFAPSTVYAGSPGLPPGAVTVHDPNVAVSNDLDDYDTHPTDSIPDPIEPWNRFWFRFNDIFYMHVAKPVYTGWTYITPQFFRTAVSNVFYNVLFPMRFINNILQGRFLAAGVEFSRLMMNVMGSAGLVDLASSQKTIVPVDPTGEDFGQTLGKWGIGQGFYIVWPFIGPSSLRDTLGGVGDYFTDPIFYLHPWLLSAAAETAFRFNDLNSIFPAYEDLKSIAVDPYLAMREAYVSLRRAQINR